MLSAHYPTDATPQRGLWVERMCSAASTEADVAVLVPTPWIPPIPRFQSLQRLRALPALERRGTIEVHYPRVPGWIGYWSHDLDARMGFPPLLRAARRLHEEKPFDVIHAHFIYPDGVVASRIGLALGIPVMTSEHAFWQPWLVERRRVGAQVDAALPGVHLVTAVSNFLRKDVAEYAGDRVATDVLPLAIDDEVFSPAPTARDPNELLYVGLLRKVKRVDVLLRAMVEARRSNPLLHLRILSASALGVYAADRREIHALIASLGLERAVTFMEGTGPAGVAEAMRRCAFVAVASTRETFCSVAGESLACGTPLIITRCGGPEEFVSEDDGVMVPPNDVDAFVDGIRTAFLRRPSFDGPQISRRLVERYGRAAWCERAMTVYDRVASRS